MYTMSDSKSGRCASKDAESTPNNLKKSMSEWQFAPSSVFKYNLPLDTEEDSYIRPNVKVWFGDQT